jgi:hypothetical protein
MEPISIIRIQHSVSGKGPFTHSGLGMYKLCNEASEMHSNFMDVPWKEGLNLDKYFLDWFCGYKSAIDLISYMKIKHIRTLIKNDYDVLSLIVTNYQIGKHQVVFTKESTIDIQILNSVF